jgi:RHS repeat-associated protein
LGTTRNTYDALNRLTSSTNHQGQRVGYAYDAASNRTELTYPDERTVRYQVDANNRVNRVTDPDGGVFAVEYDPTHNITGIHYPNQTRALMTYDAADRLLSVLNEQNDGETISRFAYTLDAVGNRVHSDEYYRWRQPNEMSHDYVYDPLYRLVRSEDSEGRITEYGYDAVGNRLQMNSNYDPLRTPTDVAPYTVDHSYNAANQLLTTDHSVFGVTAYTYDGNGNRVRREGPDVWTGSAQDVLRTEYTYDYENRLTWVGNSRDPGNGQWQMRDETMMVYDGYGRLFRRTHDMHRDTSELTYKIYLPAVARGETGGQKWVGYVYDGLDPIAEYGEPNPNHYVNYYRGLGRILEMHEFKSQQSPAGTAYYFHHDGLGSVSALTKHNGQSAHTYRYWDYGMVLGKNDRAADSSNFTDPHNHYTFTGQEWVEHTWLYHFYAREYDPLVGGWLQPDPYRGRLPEPMTLHRYGYVGTNPTTFIDWRGFDRKAVRDQYDGVNIEWLSMFDFNIREAGASAQLRARSFDECEWFSCNTWLELGNLSKRYDRSIRTLANVIGWIPVAGGLWKENILYATGKMETKEFITRQVFNVPLAALDVIGGKIFGYVTPKISPVYKAVGKGGVGIVREVALHAQGVTEDLAENIKNEVIKAGVGYVFDKAGKQIFLRPSGPEPSIGGKWSGPVGISILGRFSIDIAGNAIGECVTGEISCNGESEGGGAW